MKSVIHQKVGRCGIALTMAASLLLSNLPLAMAGPGDINSVNVGRDIQSGTYDNTAGSRTVFKNPGGDLIVGKGTTVIGREVDALGNPTGNGGSMLFDARGGMLRIDGSVYLGPSMIGGKGGNFQALADAYYQNGTVFVGQGGNVHVNVGSMTMGPDARIDAPGGVVNIKGTGKIDIQRGAIIDTSGQVIGNYDTNVIRIEGGLVNIDGILKANGLVPGEQGGAITLIALSGDVTIGAEGKVNANGADGANGWDPTDGGKGGFVHVSSKKGRIVNDGEITVNGGNGGTNSDIATGPVIYNPENGYQQTSLGQNGGNGGDAGEVSLEFKKEIIGKGQIAAIGGNGGNGQAAYSADPAAQHHYALGGNGGNGGTGGLVSFYGIPSEDVLNNTKVDGGSGGQGGPASPKDCGCSGSAGACGAPGKIVIYPPDTPPPPPPPSNPPPVFPPPYPKENPRVGDSLPPGVGSVISYNRSIFMARAPLPIIQKRKPVEVAPPPPPPPPPNPQPKKPAPPKKKVTVRGYW